MCSTSSLRKLNALLRFELYLHDTVKGTYSMQSHFDCSVIESGVSSVVSVYDVLHAGETCLAIDRRNCTSGNLFASR